MRPLILFNLCILSILASGCSKEEEEKEVVTSFEGVVLNSNTNEPLPNAKIEIVEYPLDEIPDSRKDYYTRVFQVHTDGSFSFSITTSGAKEFDVLLQINDQRISSQCYDTYSASGYCARVESGQDYKNLRIIGNPDNPIY
jgi:hypothetical protein